MAGDITRRTFPVLDGYVIQKGTLFPAQPPILDIEADVYCLAGARRGVFFDYVPAKIVWITIYREETIYCVTVIDTGNGSYDMMVGSDDVYLRIATQTLPFTARMTKDSDEVQLYTYRREMVSCRFNDPRCLGKPCQ